MLKGQFLTDRGKVRDHNEDSGGIFFNADQQFLAVIADGMGGHKAGDVASQMTINNIQTNWEEVSGLTTPEEMENWLFETIRSVNKSLFDHAQSHVECQGMGTTIVITICTPDFFTVGHVGDSRCYIANEHGFSQVTEDHSLVNALVKAGQVSKEDAQNHPRKNVVLKAVGTEQQVEPDVQSLEWEHGDRLLLCSDGLTDKLTDEQLSSFVDGNVEMGQAGQQMINLANQLGGEDNISLILIQHDVSPEEGETS
ncbi:Stp1/IreP family PP2C-type Ser/Thr phosphatase [Lentibacillus sp. N15]|uniref:Stp1/IreP family PP2C-type Ser/Thr phosphatase n=1 Tax=Lentibacillus songyuanensis TaxID=3136161 RepID=UPI0031BB4F42